MKKFRFRKNLGHDKYGSRKILGPKKFGVPKDFGSQKILDPKKFWVPKKFVLKEIFQSEVLKLEKNSIPENIQTESKPNQTKLSKTPGIV